MYTPSLARRLRAGLEHAVSRDSSHSSLPTSRDSANRPVSRAGSLKSSERKSRLPSSYLHRSGSESYPPEGYAEGKARFAEGRYESPSKVSENSYAAADRHENVDVLDSPSKPYESPPRFYESSPKPYESPPRPYDSRSSPYDNRFESPRPLDRRAECDDRYGSSSSLSGRSFAPPTRRNLAVDGTNSLPRRHTYRSSMSDTLDYNRAAESAREPEPRPPLPSRRLPRSSSYLRQRALDIANIYSAPLPAEPDDYADRMAELRSRRGATPGFRSGSLSRDGASREPDRGGGGFPESGISEGIVRRQKSFDNVDNRSKRPTSLDLRATPERSVLGKLLGDTREEAPPSPARSPGRRVSRFLRPDFYETAREDSAFVKVREEAERARLNGGAGSKQLNIANFLETNYADLERNIAKDLLAISEGVGKESGAGVCAEDAGSGLARGENGSADGVMGKAEAALSFGSEKGIAREGVVKKVSRKKSNSLLNLAEREDVKNVSNEIHGAVSPVSPEKSPVKENNAKEVLDRSMAGGCKSVSGSEKNLAKENGVKEKGSPKSAEASKSLVKSEKIVAQDSVSKVAETSNSIETSKNTGNSDVEKNVEKVNVSKDAAKKSAEPSKSAVKLTKTVSKENSIKETDHKDNETTKSAASPEKNVAIDNALKAGPIKNTEATKNTVKLEKNGSKENAIKELKDGLVSPEKIVVKRVVPLPKSEKSVEQAKIKLEDSNLDKLNVKPQTDNAVTNATPKSLKKPIEQAKVKVEDSNRDKIDVKPQNDNAVDNVTSKSLKEPVKQPKVKVDDSNRDKIDVKPQNDNAVDNVTTKSVKEPVKQTKVKVDDSNRDKIDVKPQNDNAVDNVTPKSLKEPVKQTKVKVEDSNRDKIDVKPRNDNAVNNVTPKSLKEPVEQTKVKVDDSNRDKIDVKPRNDNAVNNVTPKSLKEPVEQTKVKVDDSNRDKIDVKPQNDNAVDKVTPKSLKEPVEQTKVKVEDSNRDKIDVKPQNDNAITNAPPKSLKKPIEQVKVKVEECNLDKLDVKTPNDNAVTNATLKSLKKPFEQAKVKVEDSNRDKIETKPQNDNALNNAAPKSLQKPVEQSKLKAEDSIQDKLILKPENDKAVNNVATKSLQKSEEQAKVKVDDCNWDNFEAKPQNSNTVNNVTPKSLQKTFEQAKVKVDDSNLDKLDVKPQNDTAVNNLAPKNLQKPVEQAKVKVDDSFRDKLEAKPQNGNAGNIVPPKSMETAESVDASVVASNSNGILSKDEVKTVKKEDGATKLPTKIKLKRKVKKDLDSSPKEVTEEVKSKPKPEPANKSKFLRTLDKTIDKFEETIKKPSKTVRETSLAPADAPSVSSLVKRAVSVDDCSTQQPDKSPNKIKRVINSLKELATAPKSSPDSENSLLKRATSVDDLTNPSQTKTNQVSSMLGKFRKLEEPKKTSLLSRFRKTQSVYGGSTSDGVLALDADGNKRASLGPDGFEGFKDASCSVIVRRNSVKKPEDNADADVSISATVKVVKVVKDENATNVNGRVKDELVNGKGLPLISSQSGNSNNGFKNVKQNSLGADADCSVSETRKELKATKKSDALNNGTSVNGVSRNEELRSVTNGPPVLAKPSQNKTATQAKPRDDFLPAVSTNRSKLAASPEIKVDAASVDPRLDRSAKSVARESRKRREGSDDDAESLDSRSISSERTSPLLPHAVTLDGPIESIEARIRRKSFYSRFNDSKKQPARKVSVPGLRNSSSSTGVDAGETP